MSVARRKRSPVLRLEAETWGDQVRRAYRTQRDLYGYVYADIVERINGSRIAQVHVPTLQRLERHETVPAKASTRLQAFLVLIAYGFDPEDFELTSANVPLAGLDLKAVYEALTPTPKTSPDLHKRTSARTSVHAA